MRGESNRFEKLLCIAVIAQGRESFATVKQVLPATQISGKMPGNETVFQKPIKFGLFLVALIAVVSSFNT